MTRSQRDGGADGDSDKRARAITGREKAERRQMLVEAAAEQILEEGLDAVTIGSISRRAGLAKGTLYLYFGAKADIISAVFNYAVERWSGELRDILVDDLEDLSFCQLFWKACTQNELFFMILSGQTGDSGPHRSHESDDLRKGLIRELRAQKPAVSGLFERIAETLNVSVDESRYIVLALWALAAGGNAMDLDRLLETPLSARFNLIKSEEFFLRFGPMVIASVRADGA